jgi:hypothetical protein
MITQQQINQLKGGEKLIFFRDGRGLSTNIEWLLDEENNKKTGEIK